MLPNRYTGLIEPKVARLIVSRARRFRLRRDEIDDLQQRLVPILASFEFDEARSNGASRMTALTGVIDRHLKAYLRAKRRYQMRLARLHANPGRYGRSVIGRHEPAPPEPVDLRLDLEAAMERLSERDRAICRMLGEGWAVRSIAEKLGCDRSTVSRAILRIREEFTAAGLKAWIDPDDSGEAGRGQKAPENQR